MRGRNGYGGGFHGEMMNYGGQPAGFNNWNNPRDFHHAEDDFRKMKEGAMMRGANPPNPLFDSVKRERSRSGEKENIRQNF